MDPIALDTEDRGQEQKNERTARSLQLLLLPVLALTIVAIPALSMRGNAPVAASGTAAVTKRTPVAAAATSPAVATPVKPAADGPVFPVASRELDDVVSKFGDPRDGGRRSHTGIDIAAPRGTKVLAVGDGMIERVENTPNGGRVVWLKEKSTKRLHYFAHLESITVSRGQRVRAGQQVGTVGTTGNASRTQPHLHYAVRIDNDILDPISIFQNDDAPDSTDDDGHTMRTRLNGAALKAVPGGRTIAVLPVNQSVTVEGETGRFYRVRYRGKEGYVARWLLKS